MYFPERYLAISNNSVEEMLFGGIYINYLFSGDGVLNRDVIATTSISKYLKKYT